MKTYWIKNDDMGESIATFKSKEPHVWEYSLEVQQVTVKRETIVGALTKESIERRLAVQGFVPAQKVHYMGGGWRVQPL